MRIKYEKQAFDSLVTKPDFEAATGVANELARIELESGDIDGAAKWYKTGYDTAMRKLNMKGDGQESVGIPLGARPGTHCSSPRAG
jgi:hypothetical protein